MLFDVITTCAVVVLVSALVYVAAVVIACAAGSWLCSFLTAGRPAPDTMVAVGTVLGVFVAAVSVVLVVLVAVHEATQRRRWGG